MKKVILITLSVFSLLSCAKEEPRCMVCKEQTKGYEDRMCGTRKQLDAYETDLRVRGRAVGLSWSCQIVK